MAHEKLLSRFYSSLNLSLRLRIQELSKIIEEAGSHKEMQIIFPQLINNMFAPPDQNGWGIGQVTFERNRYDFHMLLGFLEPRGPMFRLCYKLLSDPQLKYNLPLNILPLQLQMTLERGRCPQFYADLLTMDAQALNVVALALNPFDYYMFNFALHLVNNNQNNDWDTWNCVYFALACDYLTHFLPCNPNVPVLPNISYYKGKVPMVAPLQTAHRPLCSPSLLAISDLSGISNQHPSSQTQSRNEVWRSETVLQIFIDTWMNVESFNNTNLKMYAAVTSSPERVRIVRVLVKHIHSYSAKYNSDPTASSALRKYSRQIMCSRAYHYVKHLVTTWPLDASFRLVMELWLSLIQPWRYTDNTFNQYRFPDIHNIAEEGNVFILDETFTQFIAENFPAYTCIFQLVIPRFMRLDTSVYKNAVMLFRLGKVFSQPHLVPMLFNLERAIIDNVSGSPDNSHNNSNLDQSYTYNGVSLNKWVSVAKQAISELNMTATFDYDPVWSENKKEFMMEFVKRICASKNTADKNIEDVAIKIKQQTQGLWNVTKEFFMMGDTTEEKMFLEEYKKVPNYLYSCISFFKTIFRLNGDLPFETVTLEDSVDNSSFASSDNFTLSIAQKLRNKPTTINYMGDPELMPIMSHENTILVRILYQISSKLNELYGEQFSRLWTRNDFWGYLAREVLQKPTTIQLYVKDASNQQSLVNQELSARLSLRILGSHIFVAWLILGYIFCRMFSISGISYLFFILNVWCLFVFSKVLLKILRVIDD